MHLMQGPAPRAARALLRIAPLEERGPMAMASIERMSHLGSRRPIRPDVQRLAVAT